MNRTRAQSRYRRMGYTHETWTLTEGTHWLVQPWESWRALRGVWGKSVRPAAKHLIHKGRKP